MKKKELSPICLFTYNRLNETIKTIKALQNNFLAIDSDLYIYSDGGRTEKDKEKVRKVRSYLYSISGFKSITILESPANRGLANSVISGVSEMLELNERVIVLEDDLVTSPNFLDFLNHALTFYERDNAIFSISGYTLNLPSLPGEKDYYFGYRASSWGWGIWRDRWMLIDWNVQEYEDFIKNKNLVEEFKRGGSDLPRMLKNQNNGVIDSWAIRFCFHQFRYNLKTVFPTKSKLISIGFSNEATNTIGSKRFHTPLDKEIKRNYFFEKFKNIDRIIALEFAAKFSVKSRIYNQLAKKLRRLKNIFQKVKT
jgi:hypothetical protein